MISLICKKESKKNRVKENRVEELDEIELLYINLDSRKDRQIHMTKELTRLNIRNFRRIQGLSHLNGSLGCALSHIKAIEAWNDTESRILWISEDDIQFFSTKSELNELIREFQNTTFLSVLCLGNVVKYNQVKVSNNLSASNNIQTTSCYLVKANMVPLILKSFLKSKEALLSGVPSSSASIDVVWKELQSKYIFCFPNKNFVLQIPSYSDIEKRNVNYFNL